MTSPIPPQQPNSPPGFHQFPDPQQHEDLSRLGDEITEMSAHLTAGTCQLLELIQVFDEEGGWHGFGINSSATAPALLYLLHPCSRVRTG
jgi:hypothetical protein